MHKNENEQYILCSLKGFNSSKLKLLENKIYEVNNDLIKSIFIDEDLKKLKVVLQDTVILSEKEKEIEYYLYHLCFNLIVQIETEYKCPKYSIEIIHENTDKIKINDKICLRDEYKIKRELEANSIYEKIVNSPTNIKNNFVKYERIFKTLHNPNNIMQFMSLYQFLMELLQGNKPYPSQKSVAEYLQIKKNDYDFLWFKKTRKKNSDLEEDCFTYIRNEIAHSEKENDLSLYKKLGQQVTQQLIKNLIVVINDIILNQI